MIRSTRALAFLFAATTLAAGAPALADPLVIGHRGASAYRPEHTLAAYALAIDQGADYIEPDLVSTKDRVLIARHEPYLGGDNPAFAGADSTDVARRPEFADRKKTIVLDGVTLTGWFAEDFTLDEIKTLRANERIPELRPGSAGFNGRFEVPTLQEIIALVDAKKAETGRAIGLYPETKHPTYHDARGLSLEEPLVAALTAAGYDDPTDNIFVQSFEVSNLVELNGLIDVNLVQLYGGSGQPFDFFPGGNPFTDAALDTYDQLATVAGLTFVATYADGIGPNKGRVIPVVGAGLGAPTSLVADAHALGLLVHAYTFRPENSFLPANLRIGSNPAAYGNDRAEYLAFFAAGVDGVFSDAPDRARAAVTAFAAVPEPATWAMMIAGFGLVGASSRARRGRAATA